MADHLVPPRAEKAGRATSFAGTVAKRLGRSKFDVVWLVLLALVLRVWMLDLPGPYGDEMFWPLGARYLLAGGSSGLPSVPLFGHEFPVAVAPHTGAFPVYPVALLSLITDYPFAYRVVNLIYGLLAVLFTYLLGRVLFERRVGLVAGLLLAVMPTAVIWGRIDMLFIRAFFTSSVLYFWVSWYKEGRPYDLALGCLLFGLSLSTRLETLWLIGGLTAYLVLAPSVAKKLWTKLRGARASVCFALVLLLLGASLFIVYNLGSSSGGTVAYIKAQVTGATVKEDGLIPSLVDDFAARWRNLVELFTSRIPFTGLANWQGEHGAYPWILLVVLVGGAARIIVARVRRRPHRTLEFCLLCVAVMFCESVISLSTYNAMHLVPLLPIFIILLGDGCVAALAALRKRRWAAVVFALGVCGLITADATADVRYYQEIVRTRGVGLFSSGIYKLASYLEDQHFSEVITCDWGLRPLLDFVTGGRIVAREIFAYPYSLQDFYSSSVPDEFLRNLEIALDCDHCAFVFYTEQFEQFKRKEAFLMFLRARGIAASKTVISDGTIDTYVVYSIED